MEYDMIKYDLNNDAIGYILEHLETGNILSKIIKQKLDFDSGNIYTFLPKNAHRDNINKYRCGGILNNSMASRGQDWEKVLTLDACLSKFIFDHLLLENNSYCIIEDILAKVGDKNVEINGSTLLVNNESIYYFLKQISQLNTILDVVKQCRTAWHFVGVIATGHIFWLGENNQVEVTENQLETLCKNIQVLIIGAYDGEGYLFWERKS